MRPIDPEDCAHAVVYPLRPDHVQRILTGKDVFCKYIGMRRGVKICHGTLLVLYASGGSYELVGQGTIERVEFMLPEDVLRTYRSRLFITEKELQDYKEMFVRPANEPLLVLPLKDVKKYQKPIHLSKAVTMSGLTLSKEQYRQLVMKQTFERPNPIG